MHVYASKHPLENTLVLELGERDALDLHGCLLQADGNDTADWLLSILESFHAGTSLERFHRPVEEYSIAAPIRRV